MIGKLAFTLCLLYVAVNALPTNDQIVLANSLIVGRDQDLTLWICATCDSTNKPLHAHYVHNKKSEIKSILSVYPEFVVLAFRYTANVLNVWEDILYPFQVKDDNTCKKCKVQAQYNRMWNGIRDNVFADLRQIREQTGTNKLYITGISLGGGLAGISYIDINHFKIFDNIKVVTFGAPRVGNKHWASFFEGLTNYESRRYLIKGDPITVLPECLTLLCGYKHTGIKIVCHKDTQLCQQQRDTDDDVVSKIFDTYDNIVNMDEDIKGMKGIMDHINGYPKIHSYSLIINGQVVTE